MASYTYELDSHGDTVLVFIPQNENSDIHEELEFYTLPKLPCCVKEDDIEEKVSELSDEPRDPFFRTLMKKKKLRRKIPYYWTGYSKGEAPEEQPAGSTAGAASQDEKSEDEAQRECSPVASGSSQSIRFRVSSKHLMLASPTFAASLGGAFFEAQALRRQDNLELHVGSTQEALLLFLNVIHGHANQIPRSVDVGLLCELAILADYYNCRNSLQFYVDIWLERLGEVGYKTFSKESVKWLFISWVFRKRDIFETVAQMLSEQAKAPLQCSRFRVPSGVIDQINLTRQSSIERLIHAIYALMGDLQKGKGSCSFQCDSMRLGALSKQLNSRGLFSLSAPYKGYSVKNLYRNLKKIRAPRWREYGSQCSHPCRLNPIVRYVVDSAMQSMKAIRIKEFTDESII